MIISVHSYISIYNERTNTYLDEPVPFFDDAMAMLRYSIEEERKQKPRLNTNVKGGL